MAKRSAFECLFLSLILISSCSKGPDPSNQESAFVRNAHSMVYHAGDSLIYAFGGANAREVLSDLWTLENGSWQKVSPDTTPAPRTFAALVYDDVANRLILFGGSKVLFGDGPSVRNLLNDTWQFHEGQWQQLLTVHSPSPRAEMSMAYDSKRNAMVLFGGYTIENGEYVKLADTWEFRDGDWELVGESGPSPRHGAGVVYDPTRETVLLFGGSTEDKQYGPSKGETWQWDGRVWLQVDMDQPLGVFNAAMAWDKSKRAVIRFGGWNGDSRINETWELSGNRWVRVATKLSPDARNHSALVYDEWNERLVLFGGHDGKNVFGDVWTFQNGAWNQLVDASPVRRIRNGH